MHVVISEDNRNSQEPEKGVLSGTYTLSDKNSKFQTFVFQNTFLNPVPTGEVAACLGRRMLLGSLAHTSVSSTVLGRTSSCSKPISKWESGMSAPHYSPIFPTVNSLRIKMGLSWGREVPRL